jgi:hypothetical protein
MSTLWGSNGGCQGRPFTGHGYKITIKMAHMGEDVDVTLYLRWFLVDIIYKLGPSLRYVLQSFAIIHLHKRYRNHHARDKNPLHIEHQIPCAIICRGGRLQR